MIDIRKFLVLATILATTAQIVFLRGIVFAENVGVVSPGDIVINEIAWAGSADSSNDEWIELYNVSDQSVDLTGFYIEDDGDDTYEISEGTIASHGYFLIEDSEEVSDIASDAIIGLSLANSGDSLVLKDSIGRSIDSVNSDGGEWIAGSGDDKSTMERLDPRVDGDDVDNWESCERGNGSLGRDGTSLLGTPGGMNSVYVGGKKVSMEISENGGFVDVTVSSEIVANLFAYGMEVIYDANYLNFVEGVESDVLKSDGVETSFMAEKENGAEGKILIGNARIVEEKSGINSEGELFRLRFEMIGNETGEVRFGPENFLSDLSGDVEARFVVVGDEDTGNDDGNTDDNQGSDDVSNVSDLQINLGEERYSLKLEWEEAPGADSYVVSRMMPNGSFVVLGEVSETSFVDDYALLVNLNYEYQVVAVSDGVYGSAQSVQGMETRGLSGDNDRSDRVDGRDLEVLARAYGMSYGEASYNILSDSNYDGIVDGSDLIDVGANFGMKY